MDKNTRLKLQSLGTLRVTLNPTALFALETSSTVNPLIAEARSAELSGPKIAATMKGNAAADWATMSRDGHARLDVRMLLESNDGALLYLSYTGRTDWSSGLATPPIYIFVEIEVSDARYRWLSEASIAGKGSMSPDLSSAEYELFELL